MKKILSIALVVVLLAGIAVSGTMAYLQDSDSDVNVMTLGNVSIEQHEYERKLKGDGSYETDTIDGVTSYVLKDFTQGKPLLPIVGDPNEPGNSPAYAGYDSTIVRMTQVDSYGHMQVFAGKNAQDKFVTVENTGRTDAYVRTLVAFELGEIAAADFGKVIMTSSRSTTDNDNLGQPWFKNEIGVIEIDGNNYVVVEYVYHGAQLSDSIRHENGVLPAGDTTYPSLCQVYLKHNATNEDMENIDGNKNGTYDILVLSQAVQTAGFADAATALETAFPKGENNANVPGWFEPIEFPGVLYDANDVYESSLESGEFTLGKNINTSDSANHYSGNREYAITGGRNYTINLNGHTINHDGTYQDGKNTGYTYLFTVAHDNSKLTINGEGTINSANSEGVVSIVYAQSGTETVINGGDFKPYKGIAVWAGNGSEIIINGGSFISTGSDDEELIYSSGGVIDIYGGFFHNTEQENRPVNVANVNRGTGFINIYGGTFVNFDPSTGGDDPNNIKVAAGYKVVSENQANGDVWYTVVPE